MDPIAAISFASNVISFIQFASDLCKSTRDIYDSANGCTADVITLDHIYGRLRTLSDALTSQNFGTEERSNPLENLPKVSGPVMTQDVESMDLSSLGSLCKTDCDSLLEITRKLKSSSPPNGKWKSFRLALKKVWNQKAITELEQRLGKVQAVITLDICKSMSELHLSHSDSLRSLKNRSEHLHADQKTGLDCILSSLSEIQATIGSVNEIRKQLFTVDEIRSVEQEFRQMSVAESDIEKEQAIIKSLAFDCMPVRHEAITQAHCQTFEWALGASDFHSEAHTSISQSFPLGPWLRHGSGIFWVSGKPGSGKSTLMKFINQDQRTTNILSQWASPRTPVIIRHYFWSGGTPMQRSLDGLLRTLLYEVVRKYPPIIPTIFPDQWATTGSLTWPVSRLRTSFANFVNSCRNFDVAFCFFIDGLDEHDGDHLELCNMLKELAEASNVKVCLSSRPWNVFDEAFGHKTPKLYVHELTKDDIKTFAASRLRGHPRWDSVIKDPRDGQWLIDEITTRAWGVFLWANLVTKLLLDCITNRDRFSDIRRRLNSFPIELEPFFMKILTSVEPFYHSKMATTLLLALKAEEPLNFLLYDFHDQEYDDREYFLRVPSQPLSERRRRDIRKSVSCHLNSRTRGLLELTSRYQDVTFLHRTVVDFLNKGVVKQYLNTQVDPELEFCAELSLLKAHVALIKTLKKTDKVSRVGFGIYKTCDDDPIRGADFGEISSHGCDEDSVSSDTEESIEVPVHYHATLNRFVLRSICYGAIIDSINDPDWNKQLTLAYDEMDRALAQLVIGHDWHVDAYFREQLVTSGAYNYLKRKVLEDPAYVLNLGVELAMHWVSPCYEIPASRISEDGMVAVGYEADRFRDGLIMLQRAVEAHCIDPTRMSHHNTTGWSSLLSRLLSPSPQRRLLLVGLLEKNILCSLLEQGADRNIGLSSLVTRSGAVAWAVFLSCSFDIPPVKRIRVAYLKTLDDFLGPDVGLNSCSEDSTERSLIFENFLDPLKKAAGSGKPIPYDISFMLSVSSVLVRQANGSACLVKDIKQVVQEVLGSDTPESLSL